MSTITSKISVFFLIPSLALLAAEERTSWDFRNPETTVADWLRSWSPESEAARHEDALRVEEPPGQVAGNHRALIIEDVYDSSQHSQTDEAGTPSFRWEFDPVESGELRFRAGTTGTQNQNATLTILGKDRPLLMVRLENNTSGMVVAREGSRTFQDGESWFNRARDFEVSWTADGAAAFSFTTAGGKRVEMGPLKFLAPGRPDEIVVKVGFGRATRKGLRIESLSVTSRPDPQPAFP